MQASSLGKAVLAILAIFAGTVLILYVIRDREQYDLTEEVREQASGDFVEISSGTVHYMLDGPENGEPLVLIHGVTIPSVLWENTAETLAEAGYYVLRIDLFGRGLSDRPDTEYTRAFLANQVQETIEQVFSEQEYAIAGISLGAPLAAAVAVYQPERVNRLLLLSPFTKGFDITPLQLPIVGEIMNTVILVPGLTSGLRDNFAHPEKHYPQEWEEPYRSQLRIKGFRQSYLSTLRNFASQDQFEIYKALSKTSVPVLVIWGEEDLVTPFEQHERLLEILPCASFCPIRDSGHLPHIEADETVHQLMRAFLRGGKSYIDRGTEAS